MKNTVFLSCTLLLLAACSPSSTPSPVPAEKFSNNLVVNGDAEGGTGNPLATPPVATVPGWTRESIAGTVENATVETYIGYKTQWGLTIVGPAAASLGSNFFMGGVTARSSLSQSVDLSNLTFEPGAARGYTLTALLGGVLQEDDHVDLVLEFLKSDNSVLETVTLEGPKAQQRSNESKLLPLERKGNLPTGAVKARVKLEFTRESGTWNEAFADNISLRFKLN